MKQMRVQQKVKMQRPDMSVSKNNQDKASRTLSNYLNAAEKQVKSNYGDFSTLKAILRFVTRDKTDPTEKLILDVVNRMERDKVHSQVALQISEVTMSRVQDIQKSVIFSLLPYLLGLLACAVLGYFVITAQPLSFTNPTIQNCLLGLPFAVGLLIWGSINKKKAKVAMLSTNLVFQAASAFATAKMQGKSVVAAMQNLGEMKRRAQKEESKQKENKKKSKSKSKK